MRNWLKTSAVLLFAAGTSVLSAADTSSSSRAVSPRTEREVAALLSAPGIYLIAISLIWPIPKSRLKPDGTEVP